MNRLIEKSLTSTGTFFTEEVRAGDAICSVQVVSVGGGATIAPEVSNDGVNWVSLTGVGVGYGGTASGTTLSATGITVYMVQTRYFRVRLTALTSGTATVSCCFGEGWVK